MKSILVRYAKYIRGVLSCYDPSSCFCTMVGVGYAGGMAAYLRSRVFACLNFPKFAEEIRDEIRDKRQRVAAAAGLDIEHIRSKTFVKTTGYEKYSRSVASTLAWFTSFRPWRTAVPLNRGMTRKLAALFCGTRKANASITISTLSIESFGLCFLRVPSGRHFAFSSIATATIGWPIS